jgi:hypothetical protein
MIHHFTRQYIPEDNSEHHTRRRENLKSHKTNLLFRDKVALISPQEFFALTFLL